MNFSEELDRIIQLATEGHAQKAFSLLENLEERNGMPNKVFLEIQFRKVELLKDMGEFKRVLKFAPFVVQKAKELGNALQVVDALGEYALACWLTEKYSESLENIKEAEQFLETIPKNLTSEIEKRKAWILHHKGRNYNYARDDYQKAFEFAKEAEALFKKYNDKFGIALTGDLFAEIYMGDGKKDEAFQTYKRNLEIFKEIENKWGIAHTIWKLGEIFRYRGDIVQALDYLEKSKKISEEIGHQEILAHSNGALGRLYVQKGELTRALKYYEESISIYKEHDRKYFIALSLDKLGDIYYIKGELQKALEYYQEALENLETYTTMQRFNAARAYNKIGRILHAQGEYTRAFDLYNKCLEYITNMKMSLHPFSGLSYLPHYNLIKLSIDLNKLEQAQDYLQRLKLIKEKENNKWLNQTYTLGHATLLKTKNRAIQRGEAQKLFKQVAEEELVDFELTVDAILNLIELLLDEFHRYRSEEVLQEVYKWLNKLEKIAQEKNSFSLLAESYLLQSKLSLIEMKIDKSQNLLEKALRIAEKKNLRRLADIITLEKRILVEQYPIGETGKFRNDEIPMSETAESTYFLSMVSRMIQKKFYLSETEIIKLFKQKKISVEVCFGSFSDKGWIIRKKTESCPFNKKQLRSILEYSGVLYQQGELETFYGPFPQPLIYGAKRVEWHYVTYGLRLKDEFMKDTRIINMGGRVPAIFLFIYPKQFDSMLLLSKNIISKYLNSLFVKGIPDITINQLEQVQEKILESLLS
ncbi:MAG: tetratricopeptide repeat protein, partial [Candidatus Hodarchaeales archaeon]